jgi:hypothetical protein
MKKYLNSDKMQFKVLLIIGGIFIMRFLFGILFE